MELDIAILHDVVLVITPSWAILAPLETRGSGGRRYVPRFSTTLCSILQFSTMLCSSLLHLGPSWLHLGPSWLHLGPSWLHLGPSWLPKDPPKLPQISFKKLFKRGLQNLIVFWRKTQLESGGHILFVFLCYGSVTDPLRNTSTCCAL